MSMPKSFTEVIEYLEGVFASHSLIKSVNHGYPDEQSLNGSVLYPAVFIEAEVSLSPISPGLEQYSMAIQYLAKPEQQGAQPGTRAEFLLLNAIKDIADQCHERLTQEAELRTFRAGQAISLTEHGDDMAAGWRYEVTFEVVKKVSRTDSWVEGGA